jgi:hypothetical protein
MPVYLNEAQGGCDRELIGFPHLLLCMGVVMQTGAWLYGYHFDNPNDTQGNADAFAGLITKLGGTSANAVRLYGVGNWAVRYEGGGKNAWRTEMQTIATALGYHGRVSGFDTGIIDPQDGTYVEFVPEYPQERCRIYYKRNEKMTYTNAPLAKLPTKNVVAFTSDATGAMVPKQQGMMIYTSTADIVATASNKGRLHELNYFLRLVTITV